MGTQKCTACKRKYLGKRGMCSDCKAAFKKAMKDLHKKLRGGK